MCGGGEVDCEARCQFGSELLEFRGATRECECEGLAPTLTYSRQSSLVANLISLISEYNIATMQYIRFLKTPRFKPGARRGGTVSTLIVVTSDLGESFMPRDSPITGTVQHVDGTVIARREYIWTTGMRCLAIDIPVGPQASNGKPIILQVSTGDQIADQILHEPRTTVLSVWSAPFNAGGTDEAGVGEFVERRLNIGREKYLSIWEETKNSIALHIW
jgi:hypothetical protein